MEIFLNRKERNAKYKLNFHIFDYFFNSPHYFMMGKYYFLFDEQLKEIYNKELRRIQ